MAEIDPLSGVSVFVAAARVGSFTEAAERLGMTKSAVGKSIARLERRLGFELFHRTTRRTRLTLNGEAYFTACASAMEEIASTEDVLSSRNQILSGRIHIDMPVAFGRHVLLPILLEIGRAHPALTLSLTFTDATSDLIEADVDLAIRFGELKDSSHLIARHLATQARMICAAPAYLAERGVPETIEGLAKHRCIVGAVKGPPMGWWIREGGVVKRVLPQASHQFSDGEAMVDAAVGGLGLCQVPVSMVRRHIDAGQLVPVLDDYSDVSVEISAVWPRQAHLNPRVRYIVDQLVAHAAAGHLC